MNDTQNASPAAPAASLTLAERLRQLAITANNYLNDDQIQTWIRNTSIVIQDVEQRTGVSVTTNLYYLKMESHSSRIGYSIRPQIDMIYYQEPGRDTVVVLRTDKIHHGFWELRAKMQREAERIANHTAAAATVAAAPAPSA